MGNIHPFPTERKTRFNTKYELRNAADKIGIHIVIPHFIDADSHTECMRTVATAS